MEKSKNPIESTSDDRIKVEIVNIEKHLRYKVYKIAEGKLYTDRIHDTAVILDNKIVEGPSFQLRGTPGPNPEIVNSNVRDNIVLENRNTKEIKKFKWNSIVFINWWRWKRKLFSLAL